jgi:hypothetical protein
MGTRPSRPHCKLRQSAFCIPVYLHPSRLSALPTLNSGAFKATVRPPEKPCSSHHGKPQSITRDRPSFLGQHSLDVARETLGGRRGLHLFGNGTNNCHGYFAE